jgi:hypothetical protein
MGNDWDIRPRAEKGDETPDLIFHAVGTALTTWERLESIVAELFDLLLASGNRAAFKVYQSSKTSSARIEMLSAALPLDRASAAGNAELENFVATFNKFVARRNEIAHGQVLYLDEYGYYLAPSNLMKSKWAKHGEAKFQYVASDIHHYVRQFASLANQCESLIESLKT